ncbi:MAG: hypothetical protein HDS64_11805 [Bacteroidales bacterium]|nr:hypothetical protein [Bacteroidales bacterium]MBD5373026.1 hypothetical protein [Bacteroides sp.]
MRFKTLLLGLVTGFGAFASDPIDKTLDVSSREDGMLTSSISHVRSLMRANGPKLRFNPAMPADSFPAWQAKMSEAMTRLMKHPDYQPAEPKMVKEVARPGYRLQRWETYPLPESMVAVNVLIPDGISEENPAKGAVICIPGFGQTKELLCGEEAGNYDLSRPQPDGDPAKAAMARHFADKGLIAVAVDNVSAGELSDNGHFDYLLTSRYLLELGWNYLGLCSWQNQVVLDWLKTRTDLDPSRIIISGFSLGTEPLMALGLMNPDIYAFVYNDFLCTTRDRILAMTAPDGNGNRYFPNNIEHLIPEFLTEFDFPDIVAALAPRPVICTEGGLDRDFNLIRRAYELAGAPENFEAHHYAKFAADSVRVPVTDIPAGIDRDTFFKLCNVDPPHHYFKTEHIMPWVDKLFKE